MERASCAFNTSKPVKPTAFNSDYNALFQEYLQSIDKFNHWDDFYSKCGIHKVPKACKSSAADLLLVEIGRGDLNFSSSPAKDLE